MDVFIAYDRYEHDEWYSIYNIDTNMDEAIKHFLEEDLPSFISYGPDDCHSFQLQKVCMTKTQYKKLINIHKNGSETEVTDFMIPIYDEMDFEVETIYFTDGCSDTIEIVNYYCESNGIDTEDEDAVEDARCELFSNDELWNNAVREYISATY